MSTPASFSMFGLLRRSLVHYWPTNLAIVAGVAVGAAVIAGALIVGDSVRASLRQMTLDRLGELQQVMTGPRFVREALVDEISTALGPEAKGHLAPAMVLVAGVEYASTQGETTRRAGSVNVYGVSSLSWSFVAPPGVELPAQGEAIINPALASALSVREGDQVTVWLELPSAVPRDSLLGDKDDTSRELTLTVRTILADGPGAARLGLLPSQQLPPNLFVNLETLQEALDQEQLAPSRRDPEGQLARINTILSTVKPSGTATAPLGAALKSSLRLEDINLRIVHDETLNVLSVESTQLLLEDRIARSVLDYARKRNLPVSPVMVYLINWLRNAKDPAKFSMYSTVAGLDLLDLDETFGPYEFVGATPESLASDDIVINEFLAEDLQLQVGDVIRYAYHVVGSHGELPEVEQTATVRGILKMSGATIDRQVTPTVKGITDADSLDDWEQPFPMQLDKVTDRDEAYWDDYRATPKGYLRLDEAQRLWPSRYGNLTSIRVGLAPGESMEEATAKLRQAILAALDPAALGLAFQPVREQGLQAANGSTDFTGLFIGFSFFLILAAVILVGLLFRLAVEQRVSQWGLLAALGYTRPQVRRLMLWEGALLVVVGGLVGVPASIAYANLMIYGLKTWWIGAIGTKFLVLAISPMSLVIGVVAAGVTSLIAVWWGLRQMERVSLRQQMQGVAELQTTGTGLKQSGPWRRAIGSLAMAVLLLLGVAIGVIPSSQAFSGFSWPVIVFFVSGMLLLASGLWGLSAWLQSGNGRAVMGRGMTAMARLGMRNASRRRQRSVLTAGLIASATFVIVAVAAARQNPTREQPDRSSGNGGFTLVAESSQPILYDLNTPAGRKSLNIRPQIPAQEQLLQEMQVMAFRVKPGEDASCLNLFQARVPTILGVPDRMIERGGFAFVGGGSHPWNVLKEEQADGSIPVLGDMNTLLYSLKKAPGSTIPLPSAEQPEHQLKIAGMLNGAVFQGVLLMSEANFLKLFPERAGYQYFLVEVPLSDAEAVTTLLETDLAEYGFDAEPVATRIARFLAVQNTYLSTFQSLGGLGLLLGTIGLSTVMLRNVLERRAELALLRAVGFRSMQLGGLVLAETALLLLWGLLTGALAAFMSLGPQLLSAGADVSWPALLGLLAAVAVVGLVTTLLAVRVATQVPLVTTLRGE